MTADDGLARVTYLPGVQPPPPSAVVHPEAGAAESRDILGRDEHEVRAENVSMHALTRRGMSRWEVEKTLRSKEFDESTIDAEIVRLEQVGLIDDGRLAETIVRAQQERKGMGHSAIVAELRRRHIEQSDIDEALAKFEDDGEQARANVIAEKRAGQLRSYDSETAKRRLTAFMMRKGYSSTVVRTSVDLALRGGQENSGVRFR